MAKLSNGEAIHIADVSKMPDTIEKQNAAKSGHQISSGIALIYSGKNNRIYWL